MKKANLAISLCVMFLLGVGLGIASKLLDIYTTNLGNIFSQMSIWILIGTIIAVFSATKTKAALNIFVFCIGMLIAYYVTAELTASVYSIAFLYGWAAFSACSPIFAVFTWRTKKKGAFGTMISFGILLVTLIISVVLFDGPRVYDIVIMIVLAYFLFLQKVKR